MTKPVARLTTPAQLVASVPEQLGYVPTESLVVLCLHEPRGRIGLLMRFDLPARQHELLLAKDIAARVRHAGATRIALVVFTDEPGQLARRSLAEVVRDRVGGLPVTDAVLVRQGRSWSYFCDRQTCCPREGTPVSAADETSALQLIRAERVFEGRPVLPSRAALEALVAPPTFLAAEAAAQRWVAADQALMEAVVQDGLAAVRTRSLARWRAVLSRWCQPPAVTTDEETAVLSASLEDIDVRDRVAAMSKRSGAPLRGLLEDLCRRTPAPYDAPVCTLLAWVSYAQGGGALANIALDRALASEPSYSLALILEEALLRQVPPAALREAMRGGRAA